MGRSVNKIILVGHVGRDPDVRTTGSGSKVANFSLATGYRTKSGEERTEWHRLVVWEKLADTVEQYVKKGDRLYIEGSMEYGSYEKDGVTIPTADVRVRELVMLGGSGEKRAPAPAAAQRSPFDNDDDLPFG